MFYSSYSSQKTIKTLALTCLTSLAIMGCQPQSGKNDSSINPESPSNSELSTQSVDSAQQTETSQYVFKSVQVIEQPITILALGDSLTEGLGVAEDKTYPAQLEDSLKKAGYVNVNVVNSGLSGETSSGLVNRLDWVLKTKPDITILTTGANDAMRGIDVDTIEHNLRTAIERLQNEGSIVVLGGMQIYDNLGNNYVQQFSNLYPKLAAEYETPFIPFFLEGVGGVAELNQSDAIHPTAEGYSHIVQVNILPVLEPTIQNFVEQNEVSNTL